MRNYEVKCLFRFFTISDYMKEEEFLREQHKQGFKFVRFMYPGFYFFAACEPEDVIYQLEFSDVRNCDKQGYIKLFEDTGWEYLFDVFGWSYFRKPASEVDAENHIFSDADSKISHLERVYNRRMLPLLIIFFSCLVPQFINSFSRWQLGGSGRIIFRGFFFTYLVLFCLYLMIFFHCGRGLWKLKKDFKNGIK